MSQLWGICAPIADMAGTGVKSAALARDRDNGNAGATPAKGLRGAAGWTA